MCGLFDAGDVALDGSDVQDGFDGNDLEVGLDGSDAAADVDAGAQIGVLHLLLNTKFAKPGIHKTKKTTTLLYFASYLTNQ